MNRYKKICIAALTVLMLFSFFSFTSLGAGSLENNENKINAVFVLDSSNSMLSSDKGEIRYDAFRLFVDMCSLRGDSIGFVAFGDNIIKEQKLTKIEKDEDKDALKGSISNITLSNKTDIGTGLKNAVENMRVDNNSIPLVVFLSDGQNDPQRSLEESEKDIASAIELAKKNNYPIYTIGLNSNGKVDKGLLERISNETKGKSFIVNDAGELPFIFGEIFADRSKLKRIAGGTIDLNGEYQSVKIDFPDDNVAESNIAIMSDGIEDIKVFDTSGAEVPVNSEKLYYRKSKNYAFLKFINPSSKSWVVNVKGTSGKKAVFNYIYNYNLELAAKYSPNSNIKKGDKIKANAVLMSNGKSIINNEFYSGLTGKLLVKNLDTNEIKEIKLNNTGSGFEGEYEVTENGSFEIKARVDGNSLYRESDPLRVDLNKSQVSSVGKSKWFDLSNLIEKAKEYRLYILGGAGFLLLLIAAGIIDKNIKRKKRKKKRAAKKGVVEIPRPEIVEQKDSMEESMLKGLVAASMESTITTSEIQQEEILPEKLKEESKKERENIPKKESRITQGDFSGKLMLTIKEKGREEVTHPLFKSLDMYSGSISLNKLLSELPEFKELEKVKLYPGKDGELIIKNTSQATIEKNGIEAKAGEEIFIKSEERVSITLKKGTKTIVIQYFKRFN